MRKTIKNSTGSTVLNNSESYVVHLPDSLVKNSKTSLLTFVKELVPSALNGVDKGSPGELLNALSVTLRQDFYIPPGIGVSPSNATEPTGAEEPICKLILVGASNLQKAAAH